MPSIQPVRISERSHLLDALRSFALLGVCMANAAIFSGFAYATPEVNAALPTQATDQWLKLLAVVFIDGKFYSLFSFLFGIGFSIILFRSAQKGVNGLHIFYRRLGVLALFGLAHSFLLWDGDILLLYALLGCLLPFFRNMRDKPLLITAIVLILTPLLLDLARIVSGWFPEQALNETGKRLEKNYGINGGDFVYRKESGYHEVLQWNFAGFFYRWGYLIGSNRLPKVLGLFLLGLIAGRRQLYASLDQNRILFRTILKWGLLIGLSASIVMAYFSTDGIDINGGSRGLGDTASYALGVVPLSLSYAAAFALLWSTLKWRRRLSLLAPAGRMALTNYLMQSVVGILIYYNIGFGSGGRIGPTVFLPVACGVWVLQQVYSTIWLRYFNFGPMEWLWRSLVYRKLLPLKKTPDRKIPVESLVPQTESL